MGAAAPYYNVNPGFRRFSVSTGLRLAVYLYSRLMLR
jgi:hypothetical protein